MRRRCRVIPLLGLALVAACESATMPARRTVDVYEFRLGSTPPVVLRWPTGSSVRVYVSADPDMRAELVAALTAGIAEWNRHATFGEYRLVAASSITDADVVLRWRGEVSELDLSGCLPAGARAVTTFCLTGPDPLTAELQPFPLANGTPTDVRMVVSVLESEGLISGRVASLVTHELGHVLGIARHSEEATDLMSEQQLTRTTLTQRDVSTIQTLYHTRVQLVPCCR